MARTVHRLQRGLKQRKIRSFPKPLGRNFCLRPLVSVLLMANKMRVWRIEAILGLPLRIAVVRPGPTPEDPPAEVGPRKAITELQRAQVLGRQWALQPVVDDNFPRNPMYQFEAVALASLVEAEKSNEALDLVSNDLEVLVDCISFQIQCGVHICHLELIDVTLPISVGQDREILVFPFPHGYQPAKGRQSMQMNNVMAAEIPTLAIYGGVLDDKTRSALRWYVKGLSSLIDVDQFVFYWVALELLASQLCSPAILTYRAPCGHAVPECPECGRSTERIVQGETIKGFLIRNLNVQESDAASLWKMRQMFHGSNRLDHRALKDFPKLLMVLRAATTLALRQALGVPTNDPPFVLPQGPAVSAFSFYGARKVEEKDLAVECL